MTKCHSTQHGVTTVIGLQSGKPSDTQVKLLLCKDCDLQKNKTDITEYEEWQEKFENECNINHTVWG